MLLEHVFVAHHAVVSFLSRTSDNDVLDSLGLELGDFGSEAVCSFGVDEGDLASGQSDAVCEGVFEEPSVDGDGDGSDRFDCLIKSQTRYGSDPRSLRRMVGSGALSTPSRKHNTPKMQ
jgi:hypothetical protein